MAREKYNSIQKLLQKNKEFIGKKKLSLIGQGDFTGGNSTMRSSMNIKHNTQRLTIDNPEFPFLYDGKENVVGEHSSFYMKTNKQYKVYAIVKKYEELLKGKSREALYFLHCKDDNSYKLVVREEVENLTENFGFDYNNDYLDNAEVGETIPAGNVLYKSTSYDEHMNASFGVNARTLYAIHPGVQDDAIIISESFANRMVSNSVKKQSIPINADTILLNLYGKDGDYKGLPDIGDIIPGGTMVATRAIKESRMFSDLRDSSLNSDNSNSDNRYYGEAGSEIIDIVVYCNDPNLKPNKVNRQILQYYHDARWFYTKVYKTCKKIINSGSTSIDLEINRWMRKAINYLDSQALWAFNENIVPHILIEIITRRKENIRIGKLISADVKSG